MFRSPKQSDVTPVTVLFEGIDTVLEHAPRDVNALGAVVTPLVFNQLYDEVTPVCRITGVSKVEFDSETMKFFDSKGIVTVRNSNEMGEWNARDDVIKRCLSGDMLIVEKSALE